MKDALDSFYGAKYFATIDLLSGYWQTATNTDMNRRARKSRDTAASQQTNKQKRQTRIFRRSTRSVASDRVQANTAATAKSTAITTAVTDNFADTVDVYRSNASTQVGRPTPHPFASITPCQPPTYTQVVNMPNTQSIAEFPGWHNIKKYTGASETRK